MKSLLWLQALVILAVAGVLAGPAALPVRAESGDTAKLLKLALPAAERFTQEGNVEALKAKAGVPVESARGVFWGYQGNRRLGAVVWTATPAYTLGEPIHTMTGLDREGTVTNVLVFHHKETPGWVDPINNGTFQKQFVGVQAADKLTLVVNGRAVKRGDIVSIANSTISAKSVAIGVSQARKLFQAVLSDQFKAD